MKAKEFKRYRHVKTGGIYFIVAPCTMKRDDGSWVPGVIYVKENSDGGWYVRRLAQFEDGRFEEVPL